MIRGSICLNLFASLRKIFRFVNTSLEELYTIIFVKELFI